MANEWVDVPNTGWIDVPDTTTSTQEKKQGSLLKGLSQSPLIVAGNIASASSGLLELLGKGLEKAGSEEIGKGLEEFAVETKQKAKNVIEEAYKKGRQGIEPGSVKDIILSGVEGVGSYLPLILASPLAGLGSAGTAALTTGSIGALETGRKFGEYTDKDVPDEKALKGALAHGGLTALTEAIPIGRALSPTKSLIKKLITTPLLEGGQEVVQGGEEALVDYLTTGEKPSLEQVKQQTLGAFLPGVVGGGLMAGAGHLGQRLARNIQNTELQDATLLTKDLEQYIKENIKDNIKENIKENIKDKKIETPTSEPVPESETLTIEDRLESETDLKPKTTKEPVQDKSAPAESSQEVTQEESVSEQEPQVVTADDIKEILPKTNDPVKTVEEAIIEDDIKEPSVEEAEAISEPVKEKEISDIIKDNENSTMPKPINEAIKEEDVSSQIQESEEVLLDMSNIKERLVQYINDLGIEQDRRNMFFIKGNDPSLMIRTDKYPMQGDPLIRKKYYEIKIDQDDNFVINRYNRIGKKFKKTRISELDLLKELPTRSGGKQPAVENIRQYLIRRLKIDKPVISFEDFNKIKDDALVAITRPDISTHIPIKANGNKFIIADANFAFLDDGKKLLKRSTKETLPNHIKGDAIKKMFTPYNNLKIESLSMLEPPFSDGSLILKDDSDNSYAIPIGQVDTILKSAKIKRKDKIKFHTSEYTDNFILISSNGKIIGGAMSSNLKDELKSAPLLTAKDIQKIILAEAPEADWFPEEIQDVTIDDLVKTYELAEREKKSIKEVSEKVAEKADQIDTQIAKPKIKDIENYFDNKQQLPQKDQSKKIKKAKKYTNVRTSKNLEELGAFKPPFVDFIVGLRDKLMGARGNSVVEDLLNAGKEITEADEFMNKTGFKFFRDKMIFNRTLAKKFPRFKPVVRAGEVYYEQEHYNLYEASGALQEFNKLDDERLKKLKKHLYAASVAESRGVKLNEDSQYLSSQGWDKESINALKAVRDYFKNVATEQIRQGLLANPPRWTRLSENHLNKYVSLVEEYIKSLKEKEHYIPRTRYGDYYLYIENFISKDTKENKWFSLHNDKKSIEATLEDLLKKGYEFKKGDVKWGKLKKVKTKELATYDKMPIELLADLAKFDSEAGEALAEKLGNDIIQIEEEIVEEGIYEGANKKNEKKVKKVILPQGFRKHLIKPEYVAGYDEDISKVVNEYASQLASWNARKLSYVMFDEAIKNLNKTKENYLLERAIDLRNYLLGMPQWEAQSIRQVMAVMYLSKVLTALVNSTQNFTTTLPEGVRYLGVKGAYKEWGKAHKLLGEYLVNEDNFKDKYPDLYNNIKNAEKYGVLSDIQVAEVGARARGIKGNRRATGDTLMLLFTASERVNRLHAFIMGYHIAKIKNMEDIYSFAKDFTYTTQYDYTKVNRPKIARGVGSLSFMFRLFQGNWLRQLRNLIGDKEYKAALIFLGNMFLLGGTAALPFWRTIKKALEATGEDPERELRDFMPDGALEDFFMYGLPAVAGFNISGNIAFGELAPGFERGIAPAVSRLLLGVVLDPIQRVARGVQSYKLGLKQEALEQFVISPTIRNVLQALRWAYQGKVTDSRGRVILPDIKVSEILWKIIGGTPTRISEKYSKIHSADLIVKNAKDNKNINFKLAQTFIDNDPERRKKLLKEIKEWNATHPPHERIIPNREAIRRHLITLKYPYKASVYYAPSKAKKELRKIYRDEF